MVHYRKAQNEYLIYCLTLNKKHRFGYKYLQAIREALTECDNLPDYITPQDHGFENYNKSWKIPDFKEFCEGKLNQNL